MHEIGSTGAGKDGPERQTDGLTKKKDYIYLHKELIVEQNTDWNN